MKKQIFCHLINHKQRNKYHLKCRIKIQKSNKKKLFQMIVVVRKILLIGIDN